MGTSHEKRFCFFRSVSYFDTATFVLFGLFIDRCTTATGLFELANHTFTRPIFTSRITFFSKRTEYL
jgi:hypothetical protein